MGCTIADGLLYSILSGGRYRYNYKQKLKMKSSMRTLSEYVFGIIVGAVFVFEVFVLLPVVAGY